MLTPIYCCYPSAYSLLIANLWLRHAHGQNNQNNGQNNAGPLPLAGLLISTSDGFAKGKPLPFHRVAWQTIRHSGWRYAGYELSFSLITELLLLLKKPQAKSKRLMSFKELSKHYNIPICYSKDFNDANTLNWLKQRKANIAISAFNNQFIRADFIEFFTKQLAIYNLHPALLPNFKGSEPIVPMLLNQQHKTGITLHSINLQLDAGDIHYQRCFDITPSDTVMSINQRAWLHGLILIKQLFDDINNQVPLNAQKQTDLCCEFDYYSFPKKSDIRLLKRMGRSLLTFSQWRALLNYQQQSQQLSQLGK